MRHLKFLSFCLVMVMVLGTLAGCGGGGNQAPAAKPGDKAPAAGSGPAKVIKIGVLGDMSGPSAQLGDMERKAVENAVEEKNAKGGIKGAKIEYIVADDNANPQKSRDAIEKLIESDRVLLVFGPVNSTAGASTQVVSNQKKVPQVTPITAASRLTENQPYYFRVGALADRYQMKTLADFAAKTRGFKKIAVLHDANVTELGCLPTLRLT